MKRIIQGLKSTTFQLWFIFFVFLFLGILVCFILRNDPAQLGISTDSVWQERLLFLSMVLTGGLLLFIIAFFISTYLFGKKAYRKAKISSGGSSVKVPKLKNDKHSPAVVALTQIKAHLNRRYGFFWRRKVRLLLVTGDEAAIEQLIPGLRTSQWLEGDRTVLIYGGSLSSEIDTEKYSALRKLRRGRPLDGIVRVIAEGQNLTPQISDNDLRGLEKTGDALHYSAPVYLWQLCDSAWSQAGRKPQTVGVTLPLRAMPEDIAPQFDKLLAQLREPGQQHRRCH